MFTGIVTHRGTLETVGARGEARRFVVRIDRPFDTPVELGESIAFDGVCLTVAGVLGDAPYTLAFDVVPETLRRTTLGRRAPGDVLNVERSLRVGDRLGGHTVQGHVEGTGEVQALETIGEDVRLTLRLPAALFDGVLAKGSITLDGVSLTVGEVWSEPEDGDGGRLNVYLVPHTLERTGLGTLAPGDAVNVEPDVLGRWVEQHVRRILADTDGEHGGSPRGRRR